MTHYSENAGSVEAHLFRPSGKWYETFAIDMTPYWDLPTGPVEAVKQALIDRKKDTGWTIEGHRDWVLVVPDPYHKNSYPVMIRFGQWE